MHGVIPPLAHVSSWCCPWLCAGGQVTWTSVCIDTVISYSGGAYCAGGTYGKV